MTQKDNINVGEHATDGQDTDGQQKDKTQMDMTQKDMPQKDKIQMDKTYTVVGHDTEGQYKSG